MIKRQLNYPPSYVPPREKKVDRMKEKFAAHAEILNQSKAEFDPRGDQNVGTTDPLKTLFVARISFDTSEKKLKREFEAYGPVKKLKMVYDKKTGKPR